MEVRSPFAGSPGCEVCHGAYNFGSGVELLWYNCSPVCESPTRRFYSGTTSIMVTSFKRTCATRCTSQSAVARACLHTAGHGRLMPPQETLKHPKAGLTQSLVEVTAPFPQSWCAQDFISALQAALVGTRFDFKCNCTPPTVLLWLLLCPWSWSVFLWWVPKLSCQSLLNS